MVVVFMFPQSERQPPVPAFLAFYVLGSTCIDLTLNATDMMNKNTHKEISYLIITYYYIARASPHDSPVREVVLGRMANIFLVGS